MALLTDMMNKLRRRPRPVPALEGSSPVALATAMKDGQPSSARSAGSTPVRPSVPKSAPTPPANVAAKVATEGAPASAGTATAVAEPKPAEETKAKGEPVRRASGIVESLPLRSSRQSDRDEIRELVENIGQSMDRHAERSERIAERLETVPSALETLPEMSRRQAHLIEAVTDHLEQIGRRDERMQDAIVALAQTSERHSEMLSAIRDQLVANHEGTSRLGDSVGSLEQSLVQLTGTQRRSNEVLEQLSADSSRREEHFAGQVREASRWMITAVLCCCGAAVAAVATALIAVLQ